MLFGVWSVPASARLPDVIPVLTIQIVEGIHRPTGCVAKLEFSGSMLVAAMITDPHCLPAKVQAQAVPAFKRDFHLPAPQRYLLRGR